MRTFTEKSCLQCGTSYVPIGSSSKYCSLECRHEAYKPRYKGWQDKHNLKKGRAVGVGKGGLTGLGKDNPNYKTGIGIFHSTLKYQVKEEMRYCERCSIDLINATRYHWCVHHRDHDRTNNTRENLELLCKRCHQIEHDCHKAFEGAETKVERDTLSGRYKRIEAHATET